MGRTVKIILAILAICLVGIVGWMGMRQSGTETQTVRTVTDGTGTEVSIPVHPKRVVFLNASNLDMGSIINVGVTPLRCHFQHYFFAKK